MLLFYKPGETQPRPLALHCKAYSSPCPEGAPISTRVHTVALNFTSTSWVRPWRVQDSHFLFPKLCEKARSWSGPSVSCITTMPHTKDTSGILFQPSLFVSPSGHRIKGSHITSPHPPHLLPLPQPLTPWHFLICGFSHSWFLSRSFLFCHWEPWCHY